MHPFRKSFWKKFSTIGVGHATAEGLNHVFDVALYPVTVWFLGPLMSAIVLVPLSLVWDYGVIKLYINHTNNDWFGFDSLRKSVKVRIPLFIFFSWWDPPRAFILARGRLPKNSKFTAEDWKWFILANLIGNFIWLLTLGGVFEIIRKII